MVVAGLLLESPGVHAENLFNFPRDAELLSSVKAKEFIVEEFKNYDPRYLEHRARHHVRLAGLKRALFKHQATGRPMRCAHQIFLEAKWLYHYTAYWERLNQTLDRLEERLKRANQSSSYKTALEEALTHTCYTERHQQENGAFEYIESLKEDSRPPSQIIKFWNDTFRTPTKLRDFLASLVISNISKTGKDNRAEINAAITVFTAFFYKEHLLKVLSNILGTKAQDNSERVEQFKNIYKQFLSEFQDPETGYWGAWYEVDGKIFKTSDLSITYHIISYTKGDVAHWPRIVNTTFAIEHEPYPYGWKYKGRPNNHNNYDVVKIMKFRWSKMSAIQRKIAAEKIQFALSWMLSENVSPDSGFKLDMDFSDGLDSTFYFGISFLEVIGYWQKSKKFWTSRKINSMPGLCKKLRMQLFRLGMPTSLAATAKRRLHRSCMAR